MSGFAQQFSQYSLYNFNNFLINPAVAGTRACTDSRLGYRNQWLGFDGNPISFYASAHVQIKSRKTGYMKVKHALGSYVENDQTGPSSRNSFVAAYAIHIPVRSRTYLSCGIFAGFIQYSFNNNYLKSLDVTDPAQTGNGSRFIIPELSPGVYLYNPKYFAGLSVKSILGNNISVLPAGNKLSRHFYLTAGRKFQLSDRKSALMPTIAVRYAMFGPVSIDLTGVYDIKGRLLLGLSYRGIRGGSDAVAFLKLVVNRSLDIGYAFDFPLSQVRLATLQTHELLIGFKICSSHERPADYFECPAYQ